jgi:pimeloyl-ACP methyl ester carboxylesterase
VAADEAYTKLLTMQPQRAEHEGIVKEYGEGVEAAGRALMRKMEVSQLVDPLYVRAAEDPSKIYRLNFDATGRGDPYWQASYFTQVEFAEDVVGDRGDHAQTSAGLGVPVVLRREYDKEFGQANPTLPLNGIYQPATVILEFSAKTDEQGVEDVAVRLYDSRGVETVPIGNRRYKPAEDLSAAIELSMRPGFWVKYSWLGFFNPAKQIESQGEGLYALEPYKPDKIPVIFVHGLRSDPHIWKNAMNSILEDRELAKRYQIWYYLYPTGLPIPTAAASLRKSLWTTRQYFDPEGDDPGMNRVVLVGHSMGGLLSRLQSTDSGMDFWNASFRRPPGQLGLWRTDQKLLEDSLIFDPVPFIGRDVYIATPHRGSKLATATAVDWIVSFVRRPDGLFNIAKNFATLNTDALQPELANLRRFGTTGVDSLSPEYPFFKVLDGKPVLVPFHSVIASTGGPLAESTDRIVPYSSSHLEGAQSELVIDGWHGCAEVEPTTREIDRILRLHVGLPPRRLRPEPRKKEAPTPTVPSTPEGRVIQAGISEEIKEAEPRKKQVKRPSTQIWKR